MKIIEIIEKVVCDDLSINADELRIRTKKRHIFEARWVIMFVAMSEYKYSEERAASHYGMSHCAANHLKKTINGWCETDIAYADSFKKNIEKYIKYTDDMLEKLEIEKEQKIEEDRGPKDRFLNRVSALEIACSSLRTEVESLRQTLHQLKSIVA